MKQNTINFMLPLTRLLKWIAFVLLPIIGMFICSCSENRDEDEPETPSSAVKFNLTLVLPDIDMTIYSPSAYDTTITGKFSSYFYNDASFRVLVRQNGAMINLDKSKIEILNDDGNEGKIEVDGSGQIDTNKPYDIYVLGGSWRYDEDDVYYRTTLTRNKGFYSWLKCSNRDINTKKQMTRCGTIECLYVINKSSAPIKFKHKGFDAEEKWYYSYAEVAIGSGKVTESEDGDAEGDVQEIPVYPTKKGRSCSSFYVPNGKKIQNAQLIAEINGKEVRSENRISSDIIPQLNHVYAMFAVWDGEKLTLGDDYSEPVVIDMTNEEESGINVKSVDNNGSMTIEATEAKAPKVGDYLCSGPTEYAPYGYLLRVTEVTQLSGSRSTRSLDDIKKYFWIIKTTAAAVNEVIKDIDIDYPIDLSKVSIDEVTDNEGNTITMTQEQKKKWKLPIPPLKADFLTLSPEISISPKKMTFHFHMKDWNINTFGIDFDSELETKVQLDATFKKKEPYEKTFNIRYVFLSPIEIPGTPIVLTPLFQVYLKYSLDGKAVFSFTPIHEIYDVNIGAQYNGKTNKLEPTSGSDFVHAKERFVEENRGISNMESSFTLDGSAKISLGASYSFGLWGCNYVGRVSKFDGKFDMFADLLSADFWVDLNREAKAEVGISFNDINSYWDKSDFHFTDECSWKNYLQFHAQFFARIFNPVTRKFVGYQPEIKSQELYFWNEEYFPSLFVSDFKDFQISPSNDYVNLSATKYKPFFGHSLLPEVSFGFRYAQCDANGKITGKWTVKDVSKSYAAGYPDLFSYLMKASIPMNTFEKGKYYYVCPYVQVNVGNGSIFSNNGGSYFIHRKGKIVKLTDNGTLTNNELPDIPGYDL